MAGIYFHIPFCKTRCIYCDFYSTTNGELKERFAHALCKELEMRRDYLQGEPVGTIYFGGGTPSQLNLTDFKRIFDTIGHAFDIEDAYEITLEANPDDLTPEYVQMLATLPFNRISMGIQTFDDRILKLHKPLPPLNGAAKQDSKISASTSCTDFPVKLPNNGSRI